ncbi:MAG: Na+/H+ antiporter NhaA [Sphingomonadaceae bacterium]|nr:Na+/H+ antiporter NhaA [Sphingomonadaceae bacterium]
MKPGQTLRDFLASEAAGGLLLIGAAAVAVGIANSGFSGGYHRLLDAPVGPLSVHHWINDALMALFFLLVGLEVKREFAGGHLSDPADRRLPFIAAAAGMAVPALVYLALARGDPAILRGWAIPAATDIAFALGLLALIGKRAPASLKLFLTTVAIVDDVGAVIIIAIFYAGALNLVALSAAGGILLAMIALNRGGVCMLAPYLPLAAALWVAVMLSGVHATIAGVLAALAIPISANEEVSPLHRLEHGLQPWVAYAILPLFGFANAGVALGAASPFAPLPLAIAAGLFLGKQAGVFGSVRIAAMTGFAQRPAGASWAQVYGVALLCGIGFTMSLFIGGLAFVDPAQADAVKIGVLTGSILSTIAGCLVLWFAGGSPG